MAYKTFNRFEEITKDCLGRYIKVKDREFYLDAETWIGIEMTHHPKRFWSRILIPAFILFVILIIANLIFST